ncbi:MAG TPA: sugar phosphate isomerase/epimerase [Gemmatimonadaceae bacterium]
MNRRDFVHSLTASIVSTPMFAPRLRLRTRLDRIGLELYAVRDAMRRDPERTLAAIRAIGYTDVELLWSFDNFGRTPQQVRATLDAEGLRAPSAHMAPETILKDWNKSLDTAKLLGHEYLIVPSLPSDTAKSLDRWRYWADQFNIAGAAARKAGVWLAFHNEPDHTKPIDGTIPYDMFVARTDPSAVRHQLDIGNMALGGADPMRYLEKFRDRYWSFHVKDVVADGSKDTELGKGSVNIRRILSAVPDIKRKPVYVEQEAWADSMTSARHNFQYLSTLDF